MQIHVSCTALCAGIIDDPDNSLFSYEEGKSWADYFDPDFTPAYQPTFTDPALEERTMEICGDDQFCVFDIAATEREEVGMSTMQGNLDLEMITELSQPGQCVHVCVCVWGGGVRVSYLLVGEPWKHLVHRTLWQMLTAVSVCRVE